MSQEKKQPIEIKASDLKTMIDNRAKYTDIATHYGINLAQAKRAVKDAGLTMRRFKTTPFIVVPDLPVEDVKETVVETKASATEENVEVTESTAKEEVNTAETVQENATATQTEEVANETAEAVTEETTSTTEETTTDVAETTSEGFSNVPTKNEDEW